MTNHKPATWVQTYGLTKSEQTDMAQQIIDRVNDGELSAMEAKLFLKSAESVVSRAMEGIDPLARREAERYGEKSFRLKGVNVELANTGTKYDYSECNDPELTNLQEKLDEIKKQVTARQKFLQTLKKPTTIVDDATGEIITINPPVKTYNEGLKISFD